MIAAAAGLCTVPASQAESDSPRGAHALQSLHSDEANLLQISTC